MLSLVDLSRGGDNFSKRKAYTQATIEKCIRPEKGAKITFKEEEMDCLKLNHDDISLVSVMMINARVNRIMIDTSSFVDLLYFNTFQKLGLSTNNLSSMTFLLMGFTDDSICPLESVSLYVIFGKESYSKMLMTKFIVMDIPSI